MAIFLRNCRVEQNIHYCLVDWPTWAPCSQHLFTLNTGLSVHLCISVSLPRLLSCLGFTASCGRPSASLKFLHSLIPPHYTYYISLRSIQNTTPEGVLSLCWCSLTLTLTTAKGILDGAGVTKSWLQSPRRSKSFAQIKKISTRTKFSVWIIREMVRADSQTRIGDTQTNPDARKGLVPRNVDLLLYNCPVLVEFLWFLVDSLWNLSVSLFLCVKVDSGCFWIVVLNWRIPQQNGNLLEVLWSSIENDSSLARWDDLSFSGDHSLRLLDILSADLDTSVSLPQSKTRLQKAFSPNAGALSLWHSLPQLAYGMLRVSRNLDPALNHCYVLIEFLSVSDRTMFLEVELLESFISAY